MEDSDAEEEGESGGGGGLQAELLQSYLAFVKRALRTRWLTAVITFVVCLVLTVATSAYFPKTYSCTTVLMTVGSLLDNRDSGNPLAGATGLIMRHENLEALVRDMDLIKKWEARRPPLLKLKDRIFKAVFGEMTPEIKMASMVGTLETRIFVNVEKGELTVKAEWNDGQTAAELAEAARESFLRNRHSAEISAFDERAAILDEHAARLRNEITEEAAQLKAARENRKAQAIEEQQRKVAGAAASSSAAAPVVIARPAPRRPVVPEVNPLSVSRRERLEAAKRKVTALEADRDRQIGEAQAKLNDLTLRLTPSHPEVIMQQERLAMLSQVSSDLAMARADVKSLEAEIRAEGYTPQPGGGGGGYLVRVPGVSAAANLDDELPPDVLREITENNIDPAMAAQLSGAIAKYGALRDEIRSGRIDLDTAQAAFNHRYQIIVPAEVPTKPIKPKPALVWGAGLALSLLLALLLPVLKELRTGLVTEMWQVHQLQLPVLAELRLPPHSPE